MDGSSLKGENYENTNKHSGGINLRDLGFTKSTCRSFIKASETHINGTIIAHNLGVIPKCVIVFTNEKDWNKFNDEHSYYCYIYNLIYTGGVNAECGGCVLNHGYPPAPINDTEKGFKMELTDSVANIKYIHSIYGNAYVGWRQGITYNWIALA